MSSRSLRRCWHVPVFSRPMSVLSVVGPSIVRIVSRMRWYASCTLHSFMRAERRMRASFTSVWQIIHSSCARAAIVGVCRKAKSARHVERAGERIPNVFSAGFRVVANVEPKMLRKLAVGGQPRRCRTSMRRGPSFEGMSDTRDVSASLEGIAGSARMGRDGQRRPRQHR
jgi:hypothetical protein